jgi:hypothetical protein
MAQPEKVPPAHTQQVLMADFGCATKKIDGVQLLDM